MVPGSLALFLAKRQELIATAEPGTVAARTLSDLTDNAVRTLAETPLSSIDAPIAIFALGGWGAHRLLPHSDLDLLVITRAPHTALDPLVRALLYPLWDAGFSVGHQIRSPKEHGAALAENTENLTSFLSARLLAGDTRLAARVSSRAFRAPRRRPGGESAWTHSAVTRVVSRERPGSPYLLEPDLKNGAGGQRDIDELVWYAALFSRTHAQDIEPLTELGLLTAEEANATVAAQDAITRARWNLHASAERAVNTMSIDDAENIGIDTECVQHALALCHNLLLDVRDRISATADPHPAAENTPGITRNSNVFLTDNSQTAVEWETQQIGMDNLAACALRGSSAVETFERSIWKGSLENAAPGYRDLMTLRRPALTHRYTVGAHCIRTLAALGDDSPGVLKAEPNAPYARALFVAALTHDIGKRHPGHDHPVRGAVETRAIARRLGLLPDEAEAAATLVNEHLLLPEIALTHDLTDEDVILAAAARIGDATLVEPLYQLAVADMRATGPEVWTPWRTARMGELATKLEAALSPDIDGAGIVDVAEKTRSTALRTAASAGSSRSVLDFLQRAPLRYLATRQVDSVLRDARLVQSLTGPGGAREIAFAVRSGPATGTHLIDVVTRDRPGLFASVTGAIELTGLVVLSADAFTSHAGVALDTFTVISATRASTTSETWEALESNLRDALENHRTFAVRLAERRSYYERHHDYSAPVHVKITSRSSLTTSVTVQTNDRTGLLYDLAHTLEELGLDIRRAVITTIAGQADDTFDVTDENGTPPDPSTLAERIVPALEQAAMAVISCAGATTRSGDVPLSSWQEGP